MSGSQSIAISLILLLTVSVIGCGDAATDANKTATGTPTAQSPPQESAPKKQYNAAGILIAYRGCERAVGVTRTRVEAMKIATDLSGRIRAGEDFYELAKEHSEGPTAQAGGVLGNFTSDSFVKQVVDATEAMEVGATSDPVETQFGFYVLMRREVEDVYNASHILLLHNDSQPKPQNLDRSKEESMELIKVIQKAIVDGEDFSQLALKYSNGPGKKQGGQMGNFTLTQLPAYFGEVGNVVKQLEIDEVSEPFETEVGIHLVKRNAIPKPARILGAKHILVMYRGAMRAEKISRTKEDAWARIQIVQEKLTGGQKFEDLAIEYSDCPSGPSGGDLGLFKQKEMAREFSKATIECVVGGYTDIVESPFGYHLIYRYR